MERMAMQNHWLASNGGRPTVLHYDAQHHLHHSHGDPHRHHLLQHRIPAHDPWHNPRCTYPGMQGSLVGAVPGVQGSLVGAVEPPLCPDLCMEKGIVLSVPKIADAPRHGYSHQLKDQSGFVVACVAVERPNDLGHHEEPGYIRERVMLTTGLDRVGMAFAEVFLPHGPIVGLRPRCTIFRPDGVRFGELQETTSLHPQLSSQSNVAFHASTHGFMLPDRPHRFVLSIYGASPTSLIFEGDIRAGVIRVLNERHAEVAALTPQKQNFIMNHLDPVYMLHAQPHTDLGLIVCCIVSMERMSSSSAYQHW